MLEQAGTALNNLTVKDDKVETAKQGDTDDVLKALDHHQIAAAMQRHTNGAWKNQAGNTDIMVEIARQGGTAAAETQRTLETRVEETGAREEPDAGAAHDETQSVQNDQRNSTPAGEANEAQTPQEAETTTVETAEESTGEVDMHRATAPCIGAPLAPTDKELLQTWQHRFNLDEDSNNLAVNGITRLTDLQFLDSDTIKDLPLTIVSKKKLTLMTETFTAQKTADEAITLGQEEPPKTKGTYEAESTTEGAADPQAEDQVINRSTTPTTSLNITITMPNGVTARMMSQAYWQIRQVKEMLDSQSNSQFEMGQHVLHDLSTLQQGGVQEEDNLILEPKPSKGNENRGDRDDNEEPRDQGPENNQDQGPLRGPAVSDDTMSDRDNKPSAEAGNGTWSSGSNRTSGGSRCPPRDNEGHSRRHPRGRRAHRKYDDDTNSTQKMRD